MAGAHMGAKLVAGRHVPSGFEMVIDGNQAKAWNLWWNTRLTDDPDAWDEDIVRINRMQEELGALTEHRRLVRAHVAEFCRHNPLFPRSVEILCAEIGGSRLDAAARMGCEGRGLLDALLDRSPGLARKGTLEECRAALSAWPRPGRPESTVASKVSVFLGGETQEKRAVVAKVLSALDEGDAAARPLVALAGEVRAGLEVPEGRPFDCRKCPAASTEAEPIPECGCCLGMLVDAVLLCAGSSGEKGPRFGEFRRFAEEGVLVYALALNAWLRGERADAVATAARLRYFDGDRIAKIARGVHASLGERDGAKAWLAACLLKTLAGNQRWHGRRELIDDHPEATSWLRERPAK